MNKPDNPDNNELASQSDVIVIGGGISGLATAWYLAKQGKHVRLLEKSNRSGGKIASHHQAGFTTEASASMLMNFLPEIDKFLVDSQIINSKVLRKSNAIQNRFMIKDGKLRPVSMNIKDMFTSPFWSLKSKLKLITEWAIPRNIQADETVESFITRRFGRQFLDQAIEPFIAGTLACDVKQACANTVLPRLKRLEKNYGSITAGIIAHRLKNKRTAVNPEAFSFDGGMQTLVDKLSAERNFTLHLNTQVSKLEKMADGWRISINKNDTEKTGKTQHIVAKQIVMATPANITARLLSSIDNELSKLLASIEYAPMNVVHLGFNQQDIPQNLNGVGFLVPKTEKSNLLGNLWMSSVFDQRAPEGKVLLTSYLGGSRLPEVANWSDERCINEVCEGLRLYLNISAKPTMIRVDRHKAALPLYHNNYASKTQTIKRLVKNHQGLFLNANYLDGISVRDRIYQAHLTANLMKGCPLHNDPLTNAKLDLQYNARSVIGQE